MQTFLPFPDFSKSAAALDRARLGKQRVEAMQLFNSLIGVSVTKTGRPSWENHPCRKMWYGYESALLAYVVACCREWRRRGYRDSIEKRARQCSRNGTLYLTPQFAYPNWFGDERFHRSHRSNLLAKDHAHYSSCYWADEFERGELLPYYWPVSDIWTAEHGKEA